MTTTTGQAQHIIRRVLHEKRQQSGALFPILRAIQDAPGHVPRPQPWRRLPAA